MSLDWGGGLFGASGGSALDELQKVGRSPSRDMTSRDTASRDESDIDMSDESDLNMASDDDMDDLLDATEPEPSHVTENVTENTTDHVTENTADHVTQPYEGRFPSVEPEDFISEMLGSVEEEEPVPSSSSVTATTTVTPTTTRYITLYSGVTLSRAKKYIKTTRLRTMQQDEESLKNHYGIDVSGIRQKLVEERFKEGEVAVATDSRDIEVIQSRDPHMFDTASSRSEAMSTGIGSRDSDLWVEKLRPHKLLDLNGHSDRHKDILYWLSEWNSFIFQTPSSAVQFKAKQKEKWLKKSGRIEDAVKVTNESRDSVSRPQKRILLVHGEPGTGKTTACSVLAKHLGFNTLEMNASDDRGSEAFRRGVLGPMRSHSVTSKDRPNCVILDEVDGADPIFIDKLVKFVERDEREEMWHLRKNKFKKSADKQQVLVSRPIICIANNLHGLLYKLRPHCRVVNYGRLTPAQSLRIVQNVFRTELKLQKLTSKQNRFLSDICSSTDGDIRQAINILQFGTPEVTCTVDKSALWNNIVSSLFSGVPHGKERMKHVENIVQRSLRCGEWAKLIFGAFSAYVTCLSGAGVLSHLNTITHMADWYHLYDLAERHGSRDLYHPYSMAAFSLSFGSSGKSHVTVETDYQLNNQTQTQLLRVNDIHSNIPVELRRFLTKQSLLDDLGMYLDMLSKQQRGVTVEQMTNLAESLTSLGVTLKKESQYNEITSKREDVFVFVPPVCDLSRDGFSGKSRESNQAFLESLFKVLTPDPTVKRPGEFSRVDGVKKKKVEAREVLSQPVSSQAKPKQAKSSTLFDFFVKEKVEVTASQQVRIEKEEGDKLNTWVSYFEGYSNAVRRDLTWEQLWME